MSKYTLKLLQLIDCSPNELTVRLTIEDESNDFIIHINELTYQSINEAIVKQDDYLYRLSFITKRNPFNDSYTSTMTLINGIEKRKISFKCDESYVELLERIRTVHTFEDVKHIDGVSLLENDSASKESIKKTDELVVSEKENILDKKEVHTELLTVEVEDDKDWTSSNTALIDEIEDDIKTLRESSHQTDEPKRQKVPYSKRFRNSIVATVAIIAIVIFSGEYFFANESYDLELGQGIDIPILPVQDDELEPTNDKKETNDLEQTREDDDFSDVNSDEKEKNVELDKEEEDSIEGHEMVFYEVEDVAYHVPEGYVALTFDDGPSIFTKKIVDILTEHNVPGTFFFVGDYINKYPEDVIYTYENGHKIASHTKSHKNITTLNDDEFYREIYDSIDIIERLIDEEVNLFRPPYGAITSNNKLLLKDYDIKTVMWNRDPRDWQARNKNDVLKYFYEIDPSGGIYILHENKHTLEALPEIITYIQELGLEFVGIE